MVKEQDSQPFLFRKWYMDSISDAGFATVFYSADLSWRKTRLAYTSYLTGSASEKAQTRTSIRKAQAPDLTEDNIRWQSKALSCSGEWLYRAERQIAPIQLFENKRGKVLWHCRIPSASATTRIGKQLHTGFGYVEYLEMTIPPWRLPLSELRWGRFVSSRHSLVWIDWQGSHPLSLIFLDGKQIPGVVSDVSVCWSDGKLTLQPETLLRGGPLVKTALTRVPGIRRLLPKKALQSEEYKWFSQGSLQLGNSKINGWILYEIVRMGRDNETNDR